MRRPGLVLFILAALLFLVLPSLVDFYTDWLWFGETGYQPVFLKILGTQALLGTGALAIVALFVYANLRRALRPARRRGSPPASTGSVPKAFRSLPTTTPAARTRTP